MQPGIRERNLVVGRWRSCTLHSALRVAARDTLAFTPWTWFSFNLVAAFRLRWTRDPKVLPRLRGSYWATPT